MASDDYTLITDSNFSSETTEYAFYFTSQLDTDTNGDGELTHVWMNNIRVLNNSESAIVWTSTHSISDTINEGIVDGNNGDVALNLNVKNSLFTTTVMKGLF